MVKITNDNDESNRKELNMETNIIIEKTKLLDTTFKK